VKIGTCLESGVTSLFRRNCSAFTKNGSGEWVGLAAFHQKCPHETTHQSSTATHADHDIAHVVKQSSSEGLSQSADLLIAYGEDGVAKAARAIAKVFWGVRDYSQLRRNMKLHQVVFIGSGMPLQLLTRLLSAHSTSPGAQTSAKSPRLQTPASGR
jgi:hypothetical protein